MTFFLKAAVPKGEKRPLSFFGGSFDSVEKHSAKMLLRRP